MTNLDERSRLILEGSKLFLLRPTCQKLYIAQGKTRSGDASTIQHLFCPLTRFFHPRDPTLSDLIFKGVICIILSLSPLLQYKSSVFYIFLPSHIAGNWSTDTLGPWRNIIGEWENKRGIFFSLPPPSSTVVTHMGLNP